MTWTIKALRLHWPIILVGVVSLLISGYAESLPNVLAGVHGFNGHGYDDGVYLGAAIALVHGTWPYRDFAFVQPPGIAVVMAPVALIGRLIGERDSLVLARIVTVLVAAVNASLIAWLLRFRGRAAMLSAGTIFALFPLAVTADSTLLLEPYLVLLCLIGVALAFHQSNVASPNRLFIAGLALGVAGSIKLWAIFPIVAFAIFLSFRARRVLLRFCLGVSVGFLVMIGPFVAASPSSFFRDVFIAQESRISFASLLSGIDAKVFDLTGLAGFGSFAPPTVVGICIGVFGILLAVTIIWFARTQVTNFDIFIVICTFVTVLGMLSGNIFFQHYAYFPFAFMSLLIGVCVGAATSKFKSIDIESSRFRRRLSSPVVLRFIVPIALAACVLVAVIDVQFSNSYLAETEDNGSTLAAVIPAGSCVISDQVSYLVDANRLLSSQSTCPLLIDYYGTWIEDYPSHLPPTYFYDASLVTTWNSWLKRADYLVLFSPDSGAYPRSPSVINLLHENYRLVYSNPGTYVYCDIKNSSSSSTAANADLELGVAAQREQELTLAVTDYDNSLSLIPCDVPALYDLGLVNETRGNTENAIALYEEVLALDPHYEPAMNNLSKLR